MSLRAEKAEAELEAERLAHKFQRERADRLVAAYERKVLELEQTRVLLTALRTGDDDRVQRLRDGLATLKQESEALRAQFASFADQLQATAISAETGAQDWGHMRLHVVAVLSTLESTARKMAAGQPAYVPFYKKRAEAAEADLQRLRDGLATLADDWKQSAERTRQGKSLQTRKKTGWEVLADCADALSLLTQTHGVDCAINGEPTH